MYYKDLQLYIFFVLNVEFPQSNKIWCVTIDLVYYVKTKVAVSGYIS